MQSLLAALKYLTIWGRLSAGDPYPGKIGQGSIYFPLIGLGLGLLLAFINFALSLYVASEVLSVLLVAVLAVAAGARHLDGTLKSFDAMASTRSDQRLQDTSVWGVLAVLFVLLLKIAAIDVMDERSALNLLLAPVFARWALVLFIAGHRDRFEGQSRWLAEGVKFWHLAVTTVFTLGLAVYFIGRKGLWLGLAVSLLALLSGVLFQRRQSVLNHDHFGAVIELSEVLVLLLLVSL